LVVSPWRENGCSSGFPLVPPIFFCDKMRIGFNQRKQQIMAKFSGKVLMVGYGSVAQCTLPILVKRAKIPCKNITVMDFENQCSKLQPCPSGVSPRKMNLVSYS
jgi:hypothetical protein